MFNIGLRHSPPRFASPNAPVFQFAPQLRRYCRHNIIRIFLNFFGSIAADNQPMIGHQNGLKPHCGERIFPSIAFLKNFAQRVTGIDKGNPKHIVAK